MPIKKEKFYIPPESTTVEWKPSLSQINEIINTISAFSNTEGGRIFIGISNSGKIIGTHIGKGTVEKLANYNGREKLDHFSPHLKVKNV